MSKDLNVLSRLTPADIKRFWSKIKKGTPDDCWEWMAGRFKRGYGMFTLKPFTCHAHRTIWLITFGAVPNRLYVCHTCDNPSCCNPSHLFLGTALDNNRDCQAKRRVSCGARHAAKLHPAKGEGNGFSKLTVQNVRDIRRLLNSGQTQQRVAKQFQVSQKTISSLHLKRTWAHVRD